MTEDEVCAAVDDAAPCQAGDRCEKRRTLEERVERLEAALRGIEQGQRDGLNHLVALEMAIRALR